MELVILVIHIILAVSIVGVILLQPPESGSLGGLGASNAMAGPSGRGQGNFLTRATAILATGFIVTSLILAIISGHHDTRASILDEAQSSPAMNAPKTDKAVDAAIEKKTAAEPEVKKDVPAKPAPSVPLTQ
jgi:preprotein translocase subunit SecG